MSNSNLVVKMMSGQDLMDTNTSKGFTLVEAHGEVTCLRGADGRPSISIPLEGGQVALYHPEGNTYVIKNGKTVASFAYSEYKDAKVTRIKGVAQAFAHDPNKPIIVHEDARLIHFKAPSVLEPMITKHLLAEDRADEFYPVVELKSIGARYVIYPDTQVMIKDVVTDGVVFLSYNTLMAKLNDRSPIFPVWFTNPITGKPFEEFDVYFSVAK